jgi:nucleoside 2-deoxyribosyltransferase
MPARLKCFVASALDYPDVDAIYDRAIRPVLKDMKIGVYRVDRVDHNDDIDDRIFAMLDDSDLCIADLTYARPSVYYEAGYAFGGDKPVVYVARKDHLEKKAEDNRRVHFDLQMKNIIAWTSPDDVFKRKLRRRVQLVTAPLVLRLARQEESRREQVEFQAMPQNMQLISLRAEAGKRVRDQGYRMGWYGRDEYGQRRFPDNLAKSKGNVRKYVRVVVSPTVGNLSEDQAWLIAPQLEDKYEGKVRAIETLIVFASIKRVQMSTLRDRLPHWAPVADKVFRTHRETRRSDVPPMQITIAVLDDIPSVPAFRTRIAALLKAWS